MEGKKLIMRVKKELELYLTDNTHSWSLQPDGRYIRNTPTGNQNPRSAQATLLERLGSPILAVRNTSTRKKWRFLRIAIFFAPVSSQELLPGCDL